MEELSKTLTALKKNNPNGTVTVWNILTQSVEEATIHWVTLTLMAASLSGWPKLDSSRNTDDIWSLIDSIPDFSDYSVCQLITQAVISPSSDVRQVLEVPRAAAPGGLSPWQGHVVVQLGSLGSVAMSGDSNLHQARCHYQGQYCSKQSRLRSL